MLKNHEKGRKVNKTGNSRHAYASFVKFKQQKAGKGEKKKLECMQLPRIWQKFGFLVVDVDNFDAQVANVISDRFGRQFF